jgi:hypothetical protein
MRFSERRNEYEHEGEFQSDLLDKKSRGLTLAVCLLLASIGSGSAFLWYYYDGAAIAGPAASKTDAISQLTVTLQGLQQSQQDVRRNQEIQQVDIKRLSDEIAQLAAKLDLIQSSAREAQAAAPPVHKPPKKLASKPVVHDPASQAAALLTAEEKQ